MLNHCTLMGRLAQDPELRTTTSGKSVTSFNLAVNKPTKDGDADFIPIVCWNNTAEFCSKYLSKGRQIVVEGRISARPYTDKDGNNRKAVEVIASRLYFADSNNKAAEGTGNSGTAAGGFEGAEGFVPAEGDDLPF